jgi:hypothetical protein
VNSPLLTFFIIILTSYILIPVKSWRHKLRDVYRKEAEDKVILKVSSISDNTNYPDMAL